MKDLGHISKLHLFAKDTDAPDVIKGFKFQELKTLETWLYNKVHGVNEHIYCDFEEDIFQRDLTSFKSTFKQIKLYSSKNFSFSSEEITKSLAHFFMLFVKGEYLLDEVLFIFETNTSIARKQGDNDAELLSEWVSNQGNLSNELFNRCKNKVKEIVDVYIKEQFNIIEKKGNNAELIIAKDTYENLTDEVWQNFTNSIWWIFDGISNDEAIKKSIERSLELIGQLPFPITKEEYSLVFDMLIGIIGEKSMQAEPQNRLLTNNMIDSQLLRIGSKDDKIYLNSLELWSDIAEIQYLNIGEFYQVLFAAKHCRRNNYLEEHSVIWLNLLTKYYNHKNIIRKLKREAIYEIIWLTLRPSFYNAPKNSLKGLEDLVLDFFSDFTKYTDLSSLEDALNLITIIASALKMKLIDLQEDKVIEWYSLFDSLIELLKSTAADRNIFCNLLELEGFSHLNKSSFGLTKDGKKEALISLNKIIEELPNAPLYAISQLGKRIDALVNMTIQIGKDNEFIELEQYSENILPYIQQREGNFSTAKRYADKGWNYLKSRNPNGILKALDYFHKAKDLYQNEATYEGFVLAVMGISQLYAAIGMNLASKYYSLSTIWFCFHINESQLYKRISDSYALLLHADFKQGSWMSYLQSLENYLSARNEFDTNNFNPSTDELLRKTFTEAAFILGLVPHISFQLSAFIEFEKNRMGQLYTDFLKGGVEFIDKEHINIGLEDLVSRKLDNPPINDIGARRIITWKAFGSQWNVEFENSFLTNSVGEEFASLIQIIQTEIVIREIDLHLTTGIIKIIIELIDTPKAPEQQASNSEYIWKVFLPVLNSKEQLDKSMHYGLITVSLQTILDELSLLPHSDFIKEFESLFENGLGTRALNINAYQRIYRDVYSEMNFNASMRNKFNAENLNIEQQESRVFAAKKNDSSLYNYNTSIENIKGRYKNCLGVVYLTINRLKQSNQFKELRSKLKADGWLDWQILLALYNQILDLKSKNLIRQNGKKYSNDEEWLEDYQKLFHEIRFKDEKETFVEIPINLIIDEKFEFQLKQVCANVLKSYGLEDKSRFPNFDALRTFLNERFRFNKDEIEELSPFRDI